MTPRNLSRRAQAQSGGVSWGRRYPARRPAVLWMEQHVVARSLMYPEFLRHRGQTFSGSMYRRSSGGSVTDVGVALGMGAGSRLGLRRGERTASATARSAWSDGISPGKAARSGGDRARGGIAGTGDDSVREVFARRLATRWSQCIAPTPHLRESTGNAKRKFALATCAHVDGRRASKNRRLGISEGRRRRDHGAGEAAVSPRSSPTVPTRISSSYSCAARRWLRLNPAFPRHGYVGTQFWFGRKTRQDLALPLMLGQLERLRRCSSFRIATTR